MSWYDPKRDKLTKDYLEWALGRELEPDEEPGFYRDKQHDLKYRPRIEEATAKPTKGAD